MRFIWMTVAVCCLAVAGFAQSNQDSVNQALLKADRDFNQATQDQRLDGWMQYMDENGIVERGKPVVGKDAVRAALTEQWADSNFHLMWDPDEAYSMPGGKMGYTRGHWTLTSKDEKGSPVKITGQYLTIWRQNKEGQWKIIWDGGSADPPLKAAAKQ